MAISSPKVSDGSQFHQPPQVPSCSAHQLPIHRARRFTKQAYQPSGVTRVASSARQKSLLGGNRSNINVTKHAVTNKKLV
jgi:hypothetical protein